MSALKQIEAGGIIAYKVAYAKIPGSNPIAAIFLSQVAYWSARSEDGWCWITHDNLEDQTGLSRDQQDRAAKFLVGAGILKKELRGLPAKINYLVDFEALATLVAGNPQAVLRETSNLLYKEKITEETTAPPNSTQPPDSTPAQSGRRKKTKYLRDNPPTLEQCRAVAAAHDEAAIIPAIEVEKFHAHHTGLGWVSAKGRPYITLSGVYGTWVTNWKSWNPQLYKQLKRDLETAARNNQRGPYAE